MMRMVAAMRFPARRVPADQAPASMLRGALVVGPSGEKIGTIALLIRRPGGARVAVVHSRTPRRLATTVSLHGAHVEPDGSVVLSSLEEVFVLPTPPARVSPPPRV